MKRITLAKISGNRTVDLAVDELFVYLKKIDPTLFVDVRRYSDYNKAIENVIWVGNSDSFSDLLIEVKNKYLDDSIYINVENNSGIITGCNPRSVLIAAYRFLRELGVAWIRPTDDGEIVPNFIIDSLNVKVSEKASYRHRAVCIEGSDSYENVYNMIKWIPRAGMSGYFLQFFRPFEFFDRWYKHEYNKYMDDENVSRADVAAIVDEISDEIAKRNLILHKVGHGWTCEPIGIVGEGWSVPAGDIPETTKQYLAEINGERGLFKGIALNTNLCYSNPEVRDIVTTYMADYCQKNKEIDMLHFWLADDRNNICECENCTERPADYFVMMLNEVDRKLTERNVNTKIVFLVYLDLLWPPIKEKFNNPDRFVLMFAPISRTYSESYDQIDMTKTYELPEFVKNKSEAMSGVETNLEFLKQWKKIHSEDSFVYDYHLTWDQILDVGYHQTAEILFRDMKVLHKIGLDGMVSCQLTKISFPTNLPMQLMADALWDENADFDECADKYYLTAFGEDGLLVKNYLKKISELFDPAYSREIDARSYNNEKRLEFVSEAKEYSGEFLKVIHENLAKPLPEAQLKSWEYLKFHKTYIDMYADCIIAFVQNGEEARDDALDKFVDWLCQNEMSIYKVFDVMFLKGVVKKATR